MARTKKTADTAVEETVDQTPWAYLVFAFDGDSVRIGHGATLEAVDYQIDAAGFNEVLQAAKKFYLGMTSGSRDNN